jgi:hypothetical protein
MDLGLHFVIGTEAARTFGVGLSSYIRSMMMVTEMVPETLFSLGHLTRLMVRQLSWSPSKLINVIVSACFQLEKRCNSCTSAFAAGAQCITSPFGDKPRWMLSNVSANIAVAIFRVSDFDEIRNWHYVIGGQPKLVLFNFIQSVISTWQTHELLRWKLH